MLSDPGNWVLPKACLEVIQPLGALGWDVESGWITEGRS